MRTALKEIEKDISKLAEDIADLQASAYTWERDENFNLIVNYGLDKFIFPIYPFRLHQNEIRKKLFSELIKRFLIEWPRRAGKEYCTFELLIEAALVEPGVYLMVYPTNVKAKAILWEGNITLPNGNTLNFLDMIPKKLIKKLDNQQYKIHFFNGSIIWVVGSDIDPEKLRGVNPRGAVFSEFAYQDPRAYYSTLPIFRQNGGWVICQSTYNGMNHFYQLMQSNKSDPIWCCKEESIITLVDEKKNRYITDEMIDEDRRGGMPEYLIQQEYYGAVQLNEETRYFAHQIKSIYESERIISGLINPNTNVYAAWDIGINDATAITLFQLKRVDDRVDPNIICYLECNNRDLAFYVNEIRSFCNRYNLTRKMHFFPHDAKKRDFNTGKTTIDFMREMGENVLVAPKPQSKVSAIEAMRRMLYFTSFDKNHTQRLIDCLSNYEKEYDEEKKIFKPLHNWASNGVDSYQTMTLVLDAKMVTDITYETVYYIDNV
jgi:phage terminase large subunit